MKFGAEKYVTSRVQRGKGMQVKWNEGLKYQRLLCSGQGKQGRFQITLENQP